MSKRNSQTSRIRKTRCKDSRRSLSARSIFILEKETFWYFKLHACITIWMITMMITDMMMMTLLGWPCSHWEVMHSPNITFFLFKHNFTISLLLLLLQFRLCLYRLSFFFAFSCSFLHLKRKELNEPKH